MPVQALSPPYLRRPHLRQSDYLIVEKPNESRYVPSSLVPTEIEGNIYPERFEFVFRYITPESPSPKKFRNKNVEIVLGQATKKILQVSASFDGNYPDLMSSIEQAIKTIKLAKADVRRPSLKKSYNITIDFLEQAKRDFSTTMKRELENALRSKLSPAS